MSAIVIWAMTQAPIAVVAASREISIVLAALIGVTLLGEAVPGATRRRRGAGHPTSSR